MRGSLWPSEHSFWADGLAVGTAAGRGRVAATGRRHNTLPGLTAVSRSAGPTRTVPMASSDRRAGICADGDRVCVEAILCRRRCADGSGSCADGCRPLTAWLVPVVNCQIGMLMIVRLSLYKTSPSSWGGEAQEGISMIWKCSKDRLHLSSDHREHAATYPREPLLPFNNYID
jgi:hypothetical protein